MIFIGVVVDIPAAFFDLVVDVLREFFL